jgi:hypothetical protein
MNSSQSKAMMDMMDMMDEDDPELMAEITDDEFQKELKKYPKVRDENYQGPQTKAPKEIKVNVARLCFLMQP